MRVSCTSILVALVAIAGSLPARAVVLPERSFDDLVRDADAIVAGTVVSKESSWTAPDREIVTRYRVRVDRMLKGFPVPEIELTELGGIVGDVGMAVSGVPEYAVGEQAVIFVHAEAGRLMTLAFFQGKFPIATDDSGVPRVHAPAAGPVSLDAFAERVRSALARP